MPSLMKARSGVLNSNIGGNALAPLFSTGALTIANAITDVTRLAGVQGDGATYPASMAGVWPAATNLCTNGGFETNTTGWAGKAGGGNETLARVTTAAKFGSACAKITVSGSLGYEGLMGDQNLALVNGTVYTAGAWVWCETGTVNLRLRLVNSASVAIGTTNITATTTPQRVSVTVTATADTPFEIEVLVNGVQPGVVYHVDGVSCYASAIDMPYIETDGGTASRVAGTITMPASVLDETQMWVAFRMRMGFGNSAEPANDMVLFDWRDDANNRVTLEYAATGNAWDFVRKGGGVGASNPVGNAVAIGDARTVVAVCTSAGHTLSVAGAAFAALQTTSGIPTLAATGAGIGALVAATFPFYGDILWTAAGKGTLTNAHAALFHSWGNNDPLPHMFPRSAQLTFLAHFNGDGTLYRYAA